MTDDLETTVAEFLQEAETVYDEYDQGYIDADAALRRLRPEIEDLEETLD